MKLLHIINSLSFGGAEKLLVDSIPKYKELGIEVQVLILNPIETPFCDILESKYGIKINRINGIKSIYNPLYIYKIRKYIKDFDLVHVHLFPSLYWVSLAKFTILKNKPKLIITEHNTENRRRSILIFKYLDRLIYSNYSAIIAISKGVAKNLESHLSKKNVQIINNGISIESITKAKAYSKSDFNLPEDAIIVIQVASFTPQKDQKTLIKAISLLPNNVHLFLVGQGPTMADNIKLSEAKYISKRVHFLGYRTDVPELLKTANISVLSSHYEGFGLAIVEGMAAGNACIGSNVSGLNEIIKDNGILFDSGDYFSLKNSIEKLINDKVYYNLISTKCTNKASSYNINTMVNKYISLYNNLIKK